MTSKFLITVPPAQEVTSLDLALGGTVSYYPNFLKPDEHLRLLRHLVHDINWNTYKADMYGTVVTFPRLNANMSDSKFQADTYWQENPGSWSEPIYQVKQRLQKLTGRKFSYGHLGYYKTGDNSLGYHSDRELCDGDIIASVSFGATRRFILRERYLPDGKIRKSGPPNYEVWLKGGSLFIFDQLSARDCYKHSIPKCRKMDNYTDPYGLGRVNITFREK
uniref:Alkylated DNA repair dioxygenase n=1 Tax=Pithovirus LCPAC103 TaxID=2506588 RepID=A0A481Z6G3_9VIRU|nr:MAG: alkylated DNA repair dioxygenase [Pithovirus LCPAC103]